jgi:hypothetical protein
LVAIVTLVAAIAWIRFAAPITVVVPAGIVPRISVTIITGGAARRLEPSTIVAPVALLLRPIVPTGLVLQSLSIAGVQHVI